MVGKLLCTRICDTLGCQCHTAPKLRLFVPVVVNERD